MAPWAGPLPRRARHLIPDGVPRRGELIATCAVTILVAHLLLAQLTLLLALLFVLVSKATRWRLGWLAWPVAAGLVWTLAVGPGDAIAGFTAGPSGILWHLRGGRLDGGTAQPLAGFGGAEHWLPRQFPLALIGGAAEAALLGWLDWLHTDEWAVPPRRSGLIAAVRRMLATFAVRAGAVVTREGCALGVVRASGAVAELSWAEAEHGALVVGAAAQDVTLAGLQVAHAALRRRKPVIVLDPGGDAAIAGALGAACLATGTPLLTDGSPLAAGAVADDAETVGASGLWGRGSGRERRPAGPAAVDLGRVVRERSAALLTADSTERAALACTELAALAADLRRIGVDGDALVWVPHAERVPARALGGLLGAGRDAGLAVLIGTTSPAAAAELAGLVGTALVYRVADPGLAADLAARTGTRLLPRSLAATLTPQRPDAGLLPGAVQRQDAGLRPDAGLLPDVGQRPFDGPLPGAVQSHGAGLRPNAGLLPDAGLPPGTGQRLYTAPGPAPPARGDPGFPAAAAIDLVPCPVIPARTLLTLGPAEFVLAVSWPRPRLIESGFLVPARLPTGSTAGSTAGGQPTNRPTTRPTARRPTGHQEVRA